MMPTCQTCGENMVGDGLTVVYHCPHADLSFGYEPDSNPVNCSDPCHYCGSTENQTSFSAFAGVHICDSPECFRRFESDYLGA